MVSYKDAYRLKEERLNYNLLLLHRYMLILLILSPPKVVLIVSSLLILDLLLLQSHYTPHLITRLYLAFSCSAWLHQRLACNQPTANIRIARWQNSPLSMRDESKLIPHKTPVGRTVSTRWHDSRMLRPITRCMMFWTRISHS